MFSLVFHRRKVSPCRYQENYRWKLMNKKKLDINCIYQPFFDKFQVETHLLWMIADHVISA
jgi:hypothetical protein